jgi:hypothetical protein
MCFEDYYGRPRSVLSSRAIVSTSRQHAVNLRADYHFRRVETTAVTLAYPPEQDMTVAIIAVFMSLAVCALIGWAFVRGLGIVGRGFRRRPRPPAHRANEPSIVFRLATPQEMAERDRIRGNTLPKGDVETYFENGRWKNKVQGNSRASHVHATRAEAMRVGREMARKRKVGHIIMNESDPVQEHGGYSDDPRPVQG